MKNNYKAKTLFLAFILISAMSAMAQHDTIPNDGFENWTCPSYCDPTSWVSDNQFTYLGGIGTTEVSKATAAAHVHSGTYSAKLETQSVFGNIAPGIVTTGWINSTTQDIYDGCVINYRPYKFKGWYQFAPASATDTFVVSLALYNGNTYTTTPIGTANYVTTAAASGWTEWDLPIVYTGAGTPDTMQIIISSGTGNNSASGTIAYVDDVSLVDCSLMSVSATPTAASCTQSNGSVVAASAGGASPYTYVWSNSSTTATISGLAPTSYSVVATDAEGCSASATAAVTTSNVPFTVGLTPVAASCTSATGSVTASASAGNSPYSYLWSNSTTAVSINNVTGGNYNITVTDAHGCTTTASASVSSPNVSFTVTPANGTTACGSSTGTVSVVASAGNSPYSYLWSNAATTSQISSLGSGNYTVTVSDAHGCTTTATAAVITPSGPSATDAITNVLCNGAATGAIDVTVSGGTLPIHYIWSNGTTTGSLTNVIAGPYTLTITDNNSCSFEVSANVTQPTAITATDVITNVTCFGGSNGSIVVTPSGGTIPYAYTWTGGSSGNNISAGNYDLTITDANSCTADFSYTVTQPTALVATPTQANVSCNGGTTGNASITVSGGTNPYTYSWTNGGTTNSIVNLAAGTYAVTVTDFNSCSITQNATITQPTSTVSASESTTPASSSTSTDGAASVAASGGTSPYSYAWTNQGTGSSITNVAPATYCVTVTDANSCTVSSCDSVGFTTGIKTINTAFIKIYPNPATNQLTIETSSASGKFMFSIYSLDGKLVEEKTVTGQNSTIFLNQLADGLYTYQFKDMLSGDINYGKLEILR